MQAIEVLTGENALNSISDRTFVKNWEKLYNNCPWATVYQTHSYAQAWYKSYLENYEPVLLVSVSDSKKIRGLLSLAKNKTDGCLGYVGLHHGEYQVWLSYPEDGDVFIIECLQVFRKTFPGQKLQFMYVPPETPLGWSLNSFTKKHCDLQSIRRPIIDLTNTESVSKSLKKKHNRARFNQLKRMGKLRVRSIDEPQIFKNRLPKIIPLFDFRRMAAFGFTTFGSDPLKAPYHKALSSAPGPGILKALEMTVDNSLVAVAMTLVGKGQAHDLGGIFSPFFAKQSPKRLITYMLAEQLSQDGYRVLDLTPGGGDDSFKWSLATAEDTAHILTVYPTPLKYRIAMAARKLRLLPSDLLRKMGINVDKLKSRIAFIKVRAFCPDFWIWVPGSLMRWVLNQIYFSDEIRLFCMPVENVSELKCKIEIRRNSLDDLLAFVPQKPWHTKQDFMASAAVSLSKGHNVYTIVENGRLIAWIWLNTNKNLFVNHAGSIYDLADNSGLLYDLNITTETNQSSVISHLLRSALCDTADDGDIKQIHIAVNKNDSSLQILETIGFRYQGSLFHQRRFGRSSSWTTMEQTS
jgi:hypothetical protein